MKKLLTIALICMLLLSAVTCAVFAEEDGLPFAVTPPTNVAVRWEEGNDSPTTMNFSYSLANDMTGFYRELEEAVERGEAEKFLSKYDFDEIWTLVQIDWALDDVNDSVSGWHANEFWDDNGTGLGYDEDWNIRVSEWDVVDWGLNNAAETAQTVWILRGVPNDARWNGNPETKTPGVKDQLRPEQYRYDEELDTVVIDFTQHTAYFRARLVTVTRKEAEGAEDRYYFSDWSPVCGYGKEIAKLEPLKDGELPAPVITGLRMTDKSFNDNPIVAYTLTVPDELQTMLTRVSANGGSIWIETEARVKGDTEWTALDGDRDIKAGETEWKLIYLVNDQRPSIPKDTEIELRCRYWCSQPEQEDFTSAYSKVISFGTDDVNLGGNPYDDGDPGSVPSKCPICHFCPQPLGLCVFIWLLILIAVIVVIVIILKKAGKKQK